jgi:rhamnulokinase
MSKSKFLAIDFGAESGRAILGILNDQKIELNEVHRFPNKIISVFDSLHWDILYLLEEMLNGISKAVSDGNDDIESIAIDTWGVDFGLLTEDNQLLSSPFSYRDLRTNGMLEIAFGLMDKNEIYNLTGNQFMQINTIFQLLSMVKSNNSLLKFSDKLLFMPDLFNYFLTGEKKSEYTIASTSQLLNAKEKKWEEKIFSSLNLPINCMAEIVFPGTKIGTLHKSIIDKTGLKKVDIVAVGSHDTASAVAAVPNLTNNWAFISSGTWSLIGIETDTPIINEASFKYNFTNEGGVGGKIRFLRNVMGMWIIQQLKKEWEMEGSAYTYAELNEFALKAVPFKCILDTDNAEFLNPKSMIDSINNFCANTKQDRPVSKGEYIRSVLESLAFKYKSIIGKINFFKEEKVETINIVGGGSQNELLNQFTANATGLNVIAGPVEATAFGNIMVQALAKGKIRDIKEGRKIIANSVLLKSYSPLETNLWNNKYKEKIRILDI